METHGRRGRGGGGSPLRFVDGEGFLASPLASVGYGAAPRSRSLRGGGITAKKKKGGDKEEREKKEKKGNTIIIKQQQPQCISKLPSFCSLFFPFPFLSFLRACFLVPGLGFSSAGLPPLYTRLPHITILVPSPPPPPCTPPPPPRSHHHHHHHHRQALTMMMMTAAGSRGFGRRVDRPRSLASPPPRPAPPAQGVVCVLWFVLVLFVSFLFLHFVMGGLIHTWIGTTCTRVCGYCGLLG